MWVGAILGCGNGLPLLTMSIGLWHEVPVAIGGPFLALGATLAVVGGALFVSGLRRGRPHEDRVWADDTDLWWVRHRPRVADAEPARVARRDIVEVRLSADDRAVVVGTSDGADHLVTDLGTLADRTALIAAIGATVAPRTARIDPASPLTLPRRWRGLSGVSGARFPERSPEAPQGTLIWRRPHLARFPVFGIGSLLPFVGSLKLFASAPPAWESAAALPLFVTGGVVMVVFLGEPIHTCSGWLVGTGRLEVVEIRARSGEVMGEPRRITALDLRPGRRAGRMRLDAVLADDERRRVMAGPAGRVVAVAGWLTDRADLPLTGADRGVIGMTVASEQVNR
ncbi:hypothetical protein GCM10009557_76590 [Virgisporangium ochraceum]